MDLCKPNGLQHFFSCVTLLLKYTSWLITFNVLRVPLRFLRYKFQNCLKWTPLAILPQVRPGDKPHKLNIYLLKLKTNILPLEMAFFHSIFGPQKMVRYQFSGKFTIVLRRYCIFFGDAESKMADARSNLGNFG